MNFKSTIFLFGLLLGMLWLFGLTVAHKKTAVDASYLLPKLQGNPDVVVDSITIERKVKGKEPETFQFTKDNDVWTLKVPGVQKSVKLETFRVDQIVKQIKDARRSDEAGVTDDLRLYGLDQPATTITLKGAAPGKPKQAWEFFIGRESPDQAFLFVNSSDRPNKVYGIAKNSIDSVLFKDPNHLRSRRIFEFSDSAARTIDIKEGSAELELKKGDDTIWRFEKPALGGADFEGAPPPKDMPPGAKTPEGGVKGLLAAIATMRVDSEDDFVPLSDAKLDSYGLEKGKEAMRILVGTLKNKGANKETANEILVVGKRVPNTDQVYARIVGDEGVFKLNAKLLVPIKDILQNPGALRSRDVASIDTKKVDAITVAQGKESITLLHPEGKTWELQIGAGKLQKANSQAIDALVGSMHGKAEIINFYDGAEFKKLDAEMKNPAAVLAIYENGLEQAKKEPGKEEKKDTTPQLRKDAKPAVTLTFAAAGKDTVNVQRVLADGTSSRFEVPRAVFDRLIPGDVNLAYLDTALPAIAADEIDRIEIARDHQTLDIERAWKDNAPSWVFKETADSQGKSHTDAAKTGLIVNSLATLSAKRWLHKVGPKEDLDKYGLTKPSNVITMHVRKDTAASTLSLVGLLATVSEWRGLLGGAAVLANRQADHGNMIVLKIGNETSEQQDKPAYYAQRSDQDMLFLLPADLVRLLRDVDLHDHASVVSAQPLLDATILGLIPAGLDALLASSPLVTNLVQSFDAAKVKEVSLAIRTPQELRTFTFQRQSGKEWRDLSGLKEFDLDSQKVAQLVEQLASLKAGRWVSVTGGAKGEQKLTARAATVRIEVTLDNDRTITLTVGAPFEQLGYYAQTSVMPDAVFMLAPSQVEPLLRGPGYFAKDKLASR